VLGYQPVHDPIGMIDEAVALLPEPDGGPM